MALFTNSAMMSHLLMISQNIGDNDFKSILDMSYTPKEHKNQNS